MTEIREKKFKVIFTLEGKMVGRFYMKTFKTAQQFIEVINENGKYFAAILPNKGVNLN